MTENTEQTEEKTISKEIQVSIHWLYGKPRIYADREHRDIIKRLTKKATINQEHIEALMELGFTFPNMESEILKAQALYQPVIEDGMTAEQIAGDFWARLNKQKEDYHNG